MDIKTLVLSRQEIEPLLTMKDAMESVEQAFKAYGNGKVQMLPKGHIHFDEYNGILAIMPAYIETLDAVAVKIGTGHPDNPRKYGLPLVMATIILNDPKTGVPLAIMDGTWLTAMRTGAAGGVAAKYLARKNSKTVGLVGAGVQARTQLAALISLYGRVEKVKVWSRTPLTRGSLVSEMREIYREKIGDISSVEEVKDAVEEVDIIVTTTPSMKPLVMDEWVSEGTHLNCIGSDTEGKQEIDPKILKKAKIVVDNKKQSLRIGELNVPYSKGLIKEEDIYADIGEIVSGKKPGRVSSDEITVFDSSGLPIQDVAVAWKVYELARRKNVGTSSQII